MPQYGQKRCASSSRLCPQEVQNLLIAGEGLIVRWGAATGGSGTTRPWGVMDLICWGTGTGGALELGADPTDAFRLRDRPMSPPNICDTTLTEVPLVSVNGSPVATVGEEEEEEEEWEEEWEEEGEEEEAEEELTTSDPRLTTTGPTVLSPVTPLALLITGGMDPRLGPVLSAADAVVVVAKPVLLAVTDPSDLTSNVIGVV